MRNLLEIGIYLNSVDHAKKIVNYVPQDISVWKTFYKKKETHYVQEKAKRVFFFGGHKWAFSTHLHHYFFFLSVTFSSPLSNRLTPYYFSRMASILQQEKKNHDIYFIFNSSTSPKTGNIMATLIYIS